MAIKTHEISLKLIKTTQNDPFFDPKSNVFARLIRVNDAAANALSSEIITGLCAAAYDAPDNVPKAASDERYLEHNCTVESAANYVPKGDK